MKAKRKSPAANQTGRSTTPATAPNVTQDTYETEDDQSVEGDLRDENGKLKEISCDTLDIEGQDFEDASSAVRPHDLPAHISLGAPVQTCQTLPIEYTTAATLGVKYPNFINWYKKTINKQCKQCKDANEKCVPPVTDQTTQRNFACDACDEAGITCSWEDDLMESFIREVYRLDVGEARVLIASKYAPPRTTLRTFYQEWLDEPATHSMDDEERENLRRIQRNLVPKRRLIRNPQAVVSAKSLPAAAASTKRKPNPPRSGTQPKKRRVFEDGGEEFPTPSTPLPNHAETPVHLSGSALRNRDPAATAHGSPTAIPKAKRVRLYLPPQATPQSPSNSIDSTILPTQGGSPPRPAHNVLMPAPSSTPAPIPSTPFAQPASPSSNNFNPIPRPPLTVSQSTIEAPDFDRDFRDAQEAKAYWIPVVRTLLQGRDVVESFLINPDVTLCEERRRAQGLFMENEQLRGITSSNCARFAALQERTKQLENTEAELRQSLSIAQDTEAELRQSLSIAQASLASAQCDIAALRSQSQQMNKEQELITRDMNGLASIFASFASRHPHSSAASSVAQSLGEGEGGNAMT